MAKAIEVEIVKMSAKKFKIICPANISNTVKLTFKSAEEASEWIQERNMVAEAQMVAI